MIAPRVSFDSQNGGSALPSAPKARIVEKARALGFDAVAIARADLPLGEDFERYRAFVGAGMHGEMRYLAENTGARERLDQSSILEGAKSVVCLARTYQRPTDREAEDPPLARSIARYARGQDYHNFLRRRLRQLAAFVRTLGEGVHARPLCDDAPLLERAWAARAGLGFIGKNGLVIVPGAGSMVLLGEVVTTLALPADEPMSERCGSCTKCLDACPTQAFVRPFVLDPRRCIAYLSIEHRGPIPEDARGDLGAHLFGCDECQTVCPFNRGGREKARGRDLRAFEPLERWERVHLETLLEVSEEAWQELASGSPLKRAERDGIARNAAIVLGNLGDLRSRACLERAAGGHPSAMVRDAAAWAVARLCAAG